MVLDKLKAALHDPHSFKPWRRRQEIQRLTKQLQFKGKLHSLRNRTGQLLPDPESMVAELVVYWQQTMNAKEILTVLADASAKSGEELFQPITTCCQSLWRCF